MKDTVRRGIYFNQTPCSESNNKLKNIAIVGRRLRLIFDVIIILVIVIIITIIITIVTVIRSIFLLNTNRIRQWEGRRATRSRSVRARSSRELPFRRHYCYYYHYYHYCRYVLVIITIIIVAVDKVVRIYKFNDML